MAVPFTFGESGVALQSQLDSITVGGPSSVDVTTDALSDFLLAHNGNGGFLTTMIVEMTGGSAFDNTFGVYDPADETNYVELFGGSDEPGAQVLLSVLADGSIIVNFNDTGTDFPSTWFGFYLDSSDTGGGIWYSDTALNSDGEDHMAGLRPGLYASQDHSTPSHQGGLAYMFNSIIQGDNRL